MDKYVEAKLKSRDESVVVPASYDGRIRGMIEDMVNNPDKLLRYVAENDYLRTPLVMSGLGRLSGAKGTDNSDRFEDILYLRIAINGNRKLMEGVDGEQRAKAAKVDLNLVRAVHAIEQNQPL